MGAASGSGPTRLALASAAAFAECVRRRRARPSLRHSLPMRAKVRARHRPEATGSGSPFGPFRVTVISPICTAARWCSSSGRRCSVVAEPRVSSRPPSRCPLPAPICPRARRQAEGLEAHRLQCALAGQDHQVGPGDPAAVLPLYRPEQAARFVEVDVVGPAVERRETLVSRSRPAATAAVRYVRPPAIRMNSPP